MDVHVEVEYDVVPTYKGNDQGPEPASFHCRAISTTERQRLLKTAQVGENVRAEIDMAGMFRAAVKEIQNLRVNGESVTTARRFLELPGLDELMYEVVSEIQRRSGVQDSKNSS